MDFHIREATEADFPRIVSILNSQINEPVTLEEYLRQERARPAEEPFYRVVAETETGAVAAFGLVLHESTNRPGEWFMRVRVDAPYRQKGVGSALYRHLEGYARERGATGFRSSVREEETEAYAWAERRGFATENHLRESTLDLKAWDPSPFQEAVEAAKAQGFRFATLAALTEGWERERMYRQYFEFFLPIVHDIPSNEDRPRMPFEEWYGYVKDDPEWRPDYVLLAVHGEQWAAVAHLKRLASGALLNDFTGVAREFRGRGLTLALKVEALTLAKQLDAPYIRTDNLAINPRILAVNKRLGYVPTPGHFLIIKSLA